jgi:hypothetical protein
VILDTNGNIFGGFTPVEWDSSGTFKGDDSLKSFLFTLKNPHNIPPRKFALNPETKETAIICDAEQGPHFVDIGIGDNANTGKESAILLGTAYDNGTEVAGERVLAGSEKFEVKEIEVFEVLQ